MLALGAAWSVASFVLTGLSLGDSEQPSDVEIELTESVAVAQHARALAILKRLRQLRGPLAIDDFGTG